MRTHFLLLLITLTFISCQHKGHKEWKHSGIIYKMDFIGDTANKKYDGDVKAYYSSGELYEIYKTKNGLLEGEGKGYYKSGKIKNEYYYEHGLQEGVEMDFYESGKISDEYYYSGTGQEELRKHYYEDGTLFRESTQSDSSTIGYGFDILYSTKGKIKNYKLLNGYNILYSINFDSVTGEVKGEVFNYRLIAPKKVHKGEMVQMKIIVPAAPWTDSIRNFKIGIYPINIIKSDSLKDFVVMCENNGTNWEYWKYRDGDKLRYKVSVVNIPITSKGIASYEYSPPSPGKYLFKVLVSFLRDKSNGKTTVLNYYPNLEFEVIDNK
jgi:hypothetical protein